MQPTGNNKIAFWRALQVKGWHPEGSFLYAPKGTFYIDGDANLPLHMIARLYESMTIALAKKASSEPFLRDKEQHQTHLEDMQSLVNTLKELLDKNQDA